VEGVDATPDAVERWRALRGSSSHPPTGEGFELLRAFAPDELARAAEASGEDEARLAWWAAIADDPARDTLARLRTTQIPIYQALRDAGPLTDDELVVYLNTKKSSVGPRRKELVALGLVAEQEKRVTPAGRQSSAWGVVAAENIEAAQRAARAKGPRRKHIDKYTTDEQAQIVRHLLRKDEVNALLLGDEERSKASDRARRAARAVHHERERLRRQHSERLRQAEREASPRLIYYKAIAQLRRATDAVREMERVLEENVDAAEMYGTSDFEEDDWPEIRRELEQLEDGIRAAYAQLGRLDTADDVIDVEFYEDDLELEAGEAL
jgi:hypothetical protein